MDENLKTPNENRNGYLLVTQCLNQLHHLVLLFYLQLIGFFCTVLLLCFSVLHSQGVSRFAGLNHDYQSYLPIAKFKNTSQHFIDCNPEMKEDIHLISQSVGLMFLTRLEL
jgi:hypothetical protein